MGDRLKNAGSLVLRVGLSAGLLLFLFRKVDWQQTRDVVSGARLDLLGWAALVFFLTNLIIFCRWLVLIRALKLSVPAFEALRYFFIGLFGNLFLPSAIGGDVIKILGLCRNSQQKARVVASVLLDRLSGFAAMVVVAAVAFVFGFRYINDIRLVIPIAMMATISVGMTVFIFHTRLYTWACRVFQRVPRIQKPLMALHDDAALLKGRPQAGWQAVGISCVSQLSLAFSYFLTALALQQDIGMVYFLIFVPIICVAAALPSIGGLGVREMGAVYLFTKIGMSAGVAMSISLLNFLFMVLVGLIGGVFYVVTLSSGRLQYHSSDAGCEPGQA